MVTNSRAFFEADGPVAFSWKLPVLGRSVRVIRCGSNSYVAAASFCEALGLDLAVQRAELPDFGWSDLMDLTWVDRVGVERTEEVVSRNAALLWAATLDPASVRPELVDRLKAFQIEVADVLTGSV